MKELWCKACGQTTVEPVEYVLQLTELNVQQYHDGINVGCKNEKTSILVCVCCHCGLIYAPELCA